MIRKLNIAPHLLFSFSVVYFFFATIDAKGQCPANAEFSYYVQSCSTYQFTDLSTSSNANYVIVAWDWDFGDGGTSSTQNPVHSFTPGSTYNVVLTVTADSSGVTCNDSILHQVVVDDLPTVYFNWNPDPTCFGDATYFYGTTSGNIVSWQWDFGDGGSSNIQNPIHLYTATGDYGVTVTIVDVNGCSESLTQQVSVVGIPDVDFTITPDPTCLNAPTTFDGTSSSNISSWSWDFGDGYTANTQNTVHSYAQAGTFNVTLTVIDDNGCTNSETHPVTVNQLPDPDFQHSAPTCDGDTMFFYNYSTTPNGYIQTWEWDFGDGNNIVINLPDDPNTTHVYGGPGPYTVTLTVTDSDGCIESISKDVSVVPNPVANFTYTPACDGEVVEFTDLSSTNNGSYLVSWFWNFDDPLSGSNNTSTFQNPNHLFTSVGTYDVLLIIENQEGCTDTIVKQVTVNSPSSVDFTAVRDTACVMEIIQFTGIGTDIVSWSWDFGDGGTDIVQNPQYAYMQPGTYDVVLTVEDINGCTNSVSHPVNIKDLPTALFDVSSPACANDSVYFTDYSTSPSSYIVTWHWYFGDGQEVIINYPDNPNVAHLYTNAATYAVSLVVTDLYGCEDSTATDLTIVASPIAAFDYGTSCYQEPVQFTDQSLPNGGGNIVNWAWDFGDPLSGTSNTSTLQNPTHIFTDFGTYYVQLTVTNATGCFDTITQAVYVNELPVVDFTVDPDSTCVGSITNFTGIGTDIISWFWEFGDGGTASIQNPPHIYTAPGTFYVTLTVEDINGCSNSVTHPVLVNDQPTPLFSFESFCYTDTTHFTDESFSNNSIITSWYWDFDDPASGANNNSTLQNPGHYFTNFGTYQVKLIITDLNGCQDSLTRQVQIFEKPVSGYTYDIVCDPPGTVYFYDESEPGSSGSSINEWYWEIDDGYYSTEINPHYTYTVTDTCYAVTLTVTDLNLCSSSFTDTVCILDPLEVNFTATSVCQGQATFFDASFLPANDTVKTWMWEFGDGSGPVTSAYDTISYTYASPGVYQVVLTATDTNNCTATINKNVTVYALPEPNFTYTPAMCSEPTQFTDLSIGGGNTQILEWNWNFGDIASGGNNFSTAQHPSHLYGPEDSTYYVTLSVTNQNACIDSVTLPVVKDPCVMADFEVETSPLCDGQTACFNDKSSIYQNTGQLVDWYWDFGDGQTSTYSNFQATVCHVYNAPGFYNVMLVVTGEIDNQMFQDTAFNSIYVNPTPTAEFSNSATCGNTLVQFTDESLDNGLTIDKWHWDFGNPLIAGDTSDLQNPSYVFVQQGTYDIELIATNTAGCSDTVVHTINIFPRPSAAFEFEGPCVENPTAFFDLSDSASSAIIGWHWDFGDTTLLNDTSNMQYPEYGYPEIGQYDVTLIITDQNNCQDTSTQTVEIFESPISAFVAEGNYEGIQGRVFLDNLSIGANHYFWSFGDGDTSYLEEPVKTFTEDGVYLISLVAYNERNCSDTSSLEYEVFLKGLYIPNAFAPLSPNPDIRFFKPKGYNLKQYRIEVYSAWGNLVWSSNSLDSEGRPLESWDGYYNDKLLPQGTYIWKVSAVFGDNTIWEGSDIGDGNTKNYGSVTLIH